MLKKSKGNHFHQQGFHFSKPSDQFHNLFNPLQTKEHPFTGAFFIQESEDDMGVRVVFPDMGKDPSIQLIEKTITENGTYDAITDGANGYSKVNVNVGGGGGSSDFSTANVTFSSTEFQTDFIAIYIAEGVGDELQLLSENFVFGDEVGEKILNLVLYKGSQMVLLPEGKTATVTGSATVEEYYVLITGDCTITINPVS